MVNLLDPAVQTRGELLTRFRRRGWRGRMVWVPIPLMVALLHTARTLMALLHGGLPERLGAWAVLRPRRYRTTVAEGMLREAAQRPPEPSLAPQLHP